jgi:hypothetical protein
MNGWMEREREEGGGREFLKKDIQRASNVSAWMTDIF